jgi:shikimate kinase
MFVRQAAEQFKLFTGQDAPTELMTEVVRKALSPVNYAKIEDETAAAARARAAVPATAPAAAPQAVSMIYLIGYRGVGKSTVARLLAERLGWAWSDSDEELERHYDKSIRQMFDEEGEGGFRAKESEMLELLSQRQSVVLATGGGVVLRPENRSRLKQGYVVWLQAEPQVILERLQGDPATEGRRPDLAEGGLAEIERLLAQRTPWYQECAAIVIDSTAQTPEEIVERILASLPQAAG